MYRSLTPALFLEAGERDQRTRMRHTRSTQTRVRSPYICSQLLCRHLSAVAGPGAGGRVDQPPGVHAVDIAHEWRGL